MNKLDLDFDLVVVGAGPGGIAASVTASEAGKRVALIDDSPFVGGQIWRNQGKPVGSAQRWIARLSGVEQFTRTRVVAAPAPQSLLIETCTGPQIIRWRSLILATGARELFLPFPGWTLPGVVGAGGIQALLKQGYPVRGKRIVVAGSGPLLLAVAELMRSNGAVVPIILEQTTKARLNRFSLSLTAHPSKLLQGVALRARLLRTRYATDSYPICVQRTPSGLQVHYSRRERRESIECDHLACGFGLIPNNELAQLLGCKIDAEGFVCVDENQWTGVTGIYAVGELTGIGGVDKALAEGHKAAQMISCEGDALKRRTHRRAVNSAFTKQLARAFAIRPELLKLAKPDTLICRCEDIPLSAVSNSSNARDAKLQTRCGMGPCQGRVCGPILQRLMDLEPPAVRPPLFPVALETLAGSLSARKVFPHGTYCPRRYTSPI
jgi:NADPH-dependent 2,4-dienoyl-CoA reductase/sulfur reductase-like enzyme